MTLIDYQEILNYRLGTNPIKEILTAFGIFLILVLVFKIFRKLVLTKLGSLVKLTETKFDDQLVEAIEKIHPRFYDVIALYMALKILHFSTGVNKIFDGVFIALTIYQVIFFVQHSMDYFLYKILKSDKKSEEANKTAITGISLLIKLSLWITGILLFLSNMGFNINSLMAGLGIGGVAVALAVQNILSDIFSSFSIYFDKPFAIGDFIVIGNDMGTVEKIGLKTTRILTLQGEELVVSNKELTSTRIQNFKKMQKRRVLFQLGVTYDTSLDKLKQIPPTVKEIFKGFEEKRLAELDRVHFFQYGDFSLIYEIVYFHLSSDYNHYMDIRQEVNFRIKEEFAKLGVEMAFPTQTLHVLKCQ